MLLPDAQTIYLNARHTGQEEPGATLSFHAFIDFHSLGIYTVILLSLLSCSAKMTVSPCARQENGPKPWGRVTGYSRDGGKNWEIEHNSRHSPIDTASPSPTSLILLPK